MPAPTRVYLDVENTLRVPFISGIQRVVRELSKRLVGNADSGLEFIPVVYCSQCKGWRKLSVGETERLKKLSLGDSIVDQNIPAYRKLASKLLGKKSKLKVRSLYNSITHPVWHKDFLLPTFEAGSIFLDIDASWHNELKRSSLLPALKASRHFSERSQPVVRTSGLRMPRSGLTLQSITPCRTVVRSIRRVLRLILRG